MDFVGRIRKNYLFAGSHEAAQRSAMIYSFFAICKKHEVNPYQWLKYTLENIMSINHKKIKELYPQNYKQNLLLNNMLFVGRIRLYSKVQNNCNFCKFWR
ncbi:hypothetical protein AAKU52_003225 [Pedobacter sp. CG_S7]